MILHRIGLSCNRELCGDSRPHFTVCPLVKHVIDLNLQ
jgi:hypothetical protein